MDRKLITPIVVANRSLLLFLLQKGYWENLDAKSVCISTRKDIFKDTLIFFYKQQNEHPQSWCGEHVPAPAEGKPTSTRSTAHIKSMISS